MQPPLDYATPAPNSHARGWRVFEIVSIIYPLLVMTMLYATYVAGRFELGHWPRASLDDPKEIGGLVDPLYTVTWLLFMCYPFASFASLAIAAVIAVAQYRRAAPSPVRSIFVCVIGWFVAMAVFVVDPLGVGYWFMD